MIEITAISLLLNFYNAIYELQWVFNQMHLDYLLCEFHFKKPIIKFIPMQSFITIFLQYSP